MMKMIACFDQRCLLGILVALATILGHTKAQGGGDTVLEVVENDPELYSQVIGLGAIEVWKQVLAEKGSANSYTLFVPTNRAQWDFFTREDLTRLALSPIFRPHLVDLLEYWTVEGTWEEANLRSLLTSESPNALVPLNGQPYQMELDMLDRIMINGYLMPFQATTPVISPVSDGIVYPIGSGDGDLRFFPMSMTHNAHGIGEDLGYQEHIFHIDQLLLTQDVKRITPLTVMYAPDAAWSSIAVPAASLETLLRNMMAENLYTCDTLRTMAQNGELFTPLGGNTFTITVNAQNNFPCFQSSDASATAAAPMSCITQCDILARNGVVLEIDLPLSLEPLATSDDTSGPDDAAPSSPAVTVTTTAPTVTAPATLAPSPDAVPSPTVTTTAPMVTPATMAPSPASSTSGGNIALSIWWQYVGLVLGWVFASCYF